MNREVKRVPLTKAVLPQLTRVAAYARVSSAKDAMRHSLSAQVSYYSDLIQQHPGWAYAGVYADEAKTGTKDSRENFVRLIDDCRAGRIDAIITKSISRFARNTVTLWICGTYNTLGKAACPSKQIPEPVLIDLTAEMAMDEITEIRAEDRNRLVFHFKNGEEAVKRWKDRSRAESWTPEMREAARQKALERSRQNG